MAKINSFGLTKGRRQRVRGVILSIVLNENQPLAREIAEKARKIALKSNGRITIEEVRKVLDPWVKYRFRSRK